MVHVSVLVQMADAAEDAVAELTRRIAELEGDPSRTIAARAPAAAAAAAIRAEGAAPAKADDGKKDYPDRFGKLEID